MAAKNNRKRRQTRKKKPEPMLKQVGNFLMRYEVVGITLILISALTMLSLITDSRGAVTSVWIRGLENLVGIGVWGLPFVSAALGLWLIIYTIDQLDNLAWQRPVGFTLILLALITGASMSSSDKISGGVIGDFVAGSLSDAIGLGGTWAIVTLLGICGVVVFADQILQKYGYLLWYRYQDWQLEREQRSQLEAHKAQFEPERYPPAETGGKVPRWKQALNLRGLFSGDPPLQPGAAGAEISGTTHSQPQQQNQVDMGSSDGPQTSPREAPARQVEPVQVAHSSAPEEHLSPRIIGGTSEWQPLQLPRLNQVLHDWDRVVDADDHIRLQGAKIQETLALFGVPVSFEGVNQGPTVTQYLIRPGYEERVVKGELKRTKVKVSKISGLANDLALALAASSVRIEAPVPGTSYVGVEVPNLSINTVGLRELMESETFQDRTGKLKIALGEDVKGNAIVTDLARMPHLLIAGATGAGKSVCINSIIVCLLCTHTPESLRMLMIDPKMVELSVYNRVPHLLSPVVTEVDKASAVLYWAVKEMERRYQLCSKANARDLERYNAYLAKRGEKPLPFIVVIVDEMADLMMAAPEEVEKYICRLAQMARAVGIHLIIATQRPSVDVITGLIKANFPSRIAFAVSSQTDSRVILDSPGAERLLGKGDMLFMGADGSKLDRMQGTFVSDDEINSVVRYWKGVRIVEQESPVSTNDGLAEQLGESSKEQPVEGRAAGQTPSSSRRSNRSTRATPAAGQPGKSELSQRLTQSTPGSSHLGINHAGENSGLTHASYGAPPEQPSLFDEVEEMRAQDARDEFFEHAIKIVQEAGRGSTSLLQRKLRIGYNRASRLVDQLEAAGILGPDQGSGRGRPLLIDQSQNNVENYDDSASVESLSGPSRGGSEPRIIGGDDDGEGSHQIWF